MTSRAGASPAQAALRRVIDERAFTTVFQPVYSMTTEKLVSLEALTRIALHPSRSPAGWLSEAHRAGVGIELELAVLRGALDDARLPDGLALSVNLSPAALIAPAVFDELVRVPAGALIVELTEQPSMLIHPQLLRHREQLRTAGVRLAVGNVAAKRSSMARLLALKPDQIKTDLWLTEGIDSDPARRILARKLVSVAHHQDTEVVAEGIETRAQLRAWQELGADAVQGFLLAAPAPLAVALRARSMPRNGSGTREEP